MANKQTNKSIEFIQMDSTYIYISLKGIPNMCTGGNVWGVLNQNDVSHKNMLSVLLTAKATGGLVDVYSNVCTSPSGYCCIGNILLH